MLFSSKKMLLICDKSELAIDLSYFFPKTSKEKTRAHTQTHLGVLNMQWYS